MVPAPSPGSAPSAAPRPTAPAVKTANGGYGPTQRTDTAWAVAAQVRPDNSVTVQQAMLALLQSNPDAFYGRNVNNLLAGHILRVPAREQMAAVSAPEAAREVARQYEQWTQAKRGGVPAAGPANPPAAVKPGAAAPEGAAAPSRKADDAARLRLASPSETTAGAPGAGGQGIDKLHNDLAIALESADAARHENEELRSRLSARPRLPRRRSRVRRCPRPLKSRLSKPSRPSRSSRRRRPACSIIPCSSPRSAEQRCCC